MRYPLALALASLFGSVLVAGCSSTPAPTGTVPPTDGQGRYVIELTGDNKVVPADARVPAGATVVWRVGRGGFHDVTSQPGAPQAFTSDSQFPAKMREGQEFSFAFAKSGTYPYECRVHEGMMPATLVVA